MEKCVYLFILLCLIHTSNGFLFNFGSKPEQKTKVSNHSDCIPYPSAEICMNACQLATSKGYPCENHTVQTEDGFLLTMHRLPCGNTGGRPCPPNKQREVVFLQHGLLCSSADWLVNLANESFAYILADAGYDVWLGNSRGNTYSRKHIKLSPKDKEFWQWTFDELAKYDLPASVRYTLKHTRQPKLFYAGHSQGTLIAFARLSTDPILASQIKAFFALAPVTTVAHPKGATKFLAYFTPEIKTALALVDIYEFLPNYDAIKVMGATVCHSFLSGICEKFIFSICGFDSGYFNSSRLPVYISHSPAGTSINNMDHFAQLVRSGKFQKYNYGSAQENINHYGQDTPPLYDVSTVNVPTYLYSADKDWLADPLDVAELAGKLPNLKGHVKIRGWNHLDFTWAMNAPQECYSKVIKTMQCISCGNK